MKGVSVTLFGKAVEALTQEHGGRTVAGEQLDVLLGHLAAAEQVWRSLPEPDDPPRQTRIGFIGTAPLIAADDDGE